MFTNRGYIAKGCCEGLGRESTSALGIKEDSQGSYFGPEGSEMGVQYDRVERWVGQQGQSPSLLK